MTTQKQELAADALSQTVAVALIVMARSVDTMPDALSLFDHLTRSAREQLKREWDTLRKPEFSQNFETALEKLVATIRQIQSGT